MNNFLSQVTAASYQNVIKPIFFQIDAETVHDFMVATGETFGKAPPIKNLLHSVYAYQDPRLTQNISGIEFINPIGLAAGFDYDAHLTQVLWSMGFGFQTVGTVTAEYYQGNTKPRLGRLPKSRSLLVNKGFKSGGIDEIVRSLKQKDFKIPVGMSVGSTNREYDSGAEQIENYCQTFVKAEKQLPRIKYYELNVSCPNLKTGEPFTTPQRLKTLLKEVEKLKLKKPIFIKMPTDISVDESIELLKIADKYSIAGCIFGNLTKDRKNPDLDPDEVARATKGNFSGKPTERRSNNLLQSAYKKYGKRFVLIGCGGVFSAEDAYLKIKLGASLVQMITGMIYQGPQVIGQINRGLVELMEADGYEHISEVIGKGNN